MPEEKQPVAMPNHPIVKLAHKVGLDHGGTATQLVNTLSATIMPNKGKGVSAEEVTALCMVALEYDLNPWTKEIYAFPAKGGGIVPVVGVDGWLAIANRHPQFDGMDIVLHEDEGGDPLSIEITIHRKDRAHPIRLSEYYKECRRGTQPWKDMPRRMLRNRAICQGVRVAFSVSGIYSPDEAEDIAAREPDFEVRMDMTDLLPKADETFEVHDVEGEPYEPEEEETAEGEVDLTDPNQNPFMEKV